MPIEIRELIIKVKVGDHSKSTPSSLNAQDLKRIEKRILSTCKSYVDKRLDKMKNR